MRKKILVLGNSTEFREKTTEILDRVLQDCGAIGVIEDKSDPVVDIMAERPELVITEPKANGIDCFDIIKRVGALNNFTQFIVCGEKDFDCLFNAYKLGVAEYIVLPVDEDSLMQAIKKTSVISQGKMTENATRKFYLNDRSMDALMREHISVEQINSIYNTHFIVGIYKMIFVKFDISYVNKPQGKYLDLDINYVESIIRDELGELCADIITMNKSDGIMALLNYRAEKSTDIGQRLNQLFLRLKHSRDSLKKYDKTLCISEEVNDPCKVWELKEEIRDAEWSRLDIGNNKIIPWNSKSKYISHEQKQEISQLVNNVKNAISTLDVNQFVEGVRKMYLLPHDVVVSREFRISMKKIIYYPYEIFWDDILKFTDPAINADNLAFLTHLCTSFVSHEKLIINEYTSLLNNIAQHGRTKYSPVIHSTMAFVENNYYEKITLAMAAEHVNLTESYLSYVFKKETGNNFLKYVKEYKCTKMKEHLLNPKVSISEIAYKFGFPTVQSFSKYFSSVCNMTPSAYRKLHNETDVDANAPRSDTTQLDSMII